MNRWEDWWTQAGRDLAHASRSVQGDAPEWAAFAAQQAAEKALKSLVFFLGGEPWGHSVTKLVQDLPEQARAGKAVVQAAQQLDRHYILARYPNGFAWGHPGEYYSLEDAKGAIDDAQAIFAFCRCHLPGSQAADPGA